MGARLLYASAMMRWLLMVVVLVACGKKDENPKPVQESSPSPGDTEQSRTEPAGKAAAVDPAPRDDALPTAPKASKPVADQPPTRQYWQGVADGRRLAKAKKYKEAIVKFREALALFPGEPAGLSELSLALFRVEDLDTAEEIAVQAIAKSTGKQRAAALYNLGRIKEAQGEPEKAAEHYTDSLQLRANKIVSKRLASLSKEPVEALRTMEWDPVDDIKTICEESEFSYELVECQDKKITVAIKNRKGPFQEVALWQIGGTDYPEGWVVIKIEETYYRSEPLFKLLYSYDTASGSLEAAEVVDTSSGPILRFDTKNRGISRFMSWNQESSTFCGVGPSKLLTCTSPISTSNRELGWGLDDDEDPNFSEDPDKEEAVLTKIALGNDGVLMADGKKVQKLEFP